MLTLTAMAAVPVPSPINIGAQLVKEITVEDIIKLCKDYRFVEASSEDGYIVFLHPDGSKFRFKTTNTDIPTTIVEVITTEKPNTIKTHLTGMGYKKIKNGYEQCYGINKLNTSCTIKGSNPRIITFIRRHKAQ